jgi:hypothetical protein
MARMDWKKSRKYRVFEEKYEPGTMLKNGRVVPPAPMDSLAVRAAKVEREWLMTGRKPQPTRPAKRGEAS